MNIKCACIKCLTEYSPQMGQICPACGGEIRPVHTEIEKKPRAKK